MVKSNDSPLNDFMPFVYILGIIVLLWVTYWAGYKSGLLSGQLLCGLQ